MKFSPTNFALLKRGPDHYMIQFLPSGFFFELFTDFDTITLDGFTLCPRGELPSLISALTKLNEELTAGIPPA